MAATDPCDESLFWRASPSVGRYCGVIYFTAIFKAWKEEFGRAKDVRESAKSVSKPMDHKFYAAFKEGVYDAVRNTEKFAHQNDIRLSAQSDDWERAWETPTSLFLVDFQATWKGLEASAPTSGAATSLDHDPSPKGTVAQSSTRCVGDSLYGQFNSVSKAKRQTKLVAEVCLASKPGQDNDGANTALHAYSRKLLAGQMSDSLTSHEALYRQVEFRLKLMRTATHMLHAVRIPLPLGLRCSDFDVQEFEREIREVPNDLRARKYTAARDRILTTVLPDPLPIQGYRWNKPHRYIAAALAVDVSITNAEELQAAVARLELVHALNVATIKKDLERDEGIWSCKQTWFQKIGKRLRSVSPE
ncbi:hypothetical protein CC86DRAFT_468796 [Ophiobolus disseminans]|uniref:Uncharacterized protein n=1 Tax=Ophiobolus disseminans TaxID=1469910 RepID=A0A6A6ZSL6_9PLEO|nr:hypothetical protein CC86DRAFT_468796 [Ophiobolus disseminans]